MVTLPRSVLKFLGSFYGKWAGNNCLKYLFGLKTQLNPYMAKVWQNKLKLIQANLFCKYFQFPRATLWDQNGNLFFNKTCFTRILARLGLGAPSDTALHCIFKVKFHFNFKLVCFLAAQNNHKKRALRKTVNCISYLECLAN